MAVAKSYQNLTIVGEPYSVSGKMYVVVKNETTNMTRQVRWYSDAEYAKMYGESPKAKEPVKTQKEALGFTEGYITIFKGNTYQHLEWFRESVAKYNKLFGWYISSYYGIPVDLPLDLTPIRIDWHKVGDENGTLNPDHAVKEYLETLLYEPSISEYIGTLGQRLELIVTIKRVYTSSNYYGAYSIITMEDEAGNELVWSTSPRDWKEGETKKIRGTVKDHKIYRNIKQTLLTRCAEVR